MQYNEQMKKSHNRNIRLTFNSSIVDRFLPLPVQLNTGNHQSVLINLTYNARSFQLQT